MQPGSLHAAGFMRRFHIGGLAILQVGANQELGQEAEGFLFLRRNTRYTPYTANTLDRLGLAPFGVYEV